MSSKPNSLPAHVAIILDGNGRWAKMRGQLRRMGHKKGAQNVKTIVRAASDQGIKTLTLYAFSTENWRRSTTEVTLLMRLFSWYLEHYIDELNEHNVQAHVIGDRERLSADLIAKIERFETATEKNTGLVLNIALNYGGREEILQAARRYADDFAQNKMPTLTEEQFQRYLYPSAMTDVDLLIRTGGDQRISNFLLWQISYAELYFADTLWPDFSPQDLALAIASFAGRERRFGGLQGEE
ncbi:MAG: isoprenyl transferase [Negativicoccus succinicivorans]|uniref:isoprenyl transferase n=1 Tax=Negativicoccus succinicivorans TaxID=620903 RepID=UPI00291594EE|nr:isoprenyl transferase [Negativicoccus succinicivorans]MDU5395353.1 isoprenyl transferase [Negativicoccus succinicivorans]